MIVLCLRIQHTVVRENEAEDDLPWLACADADGEKEICLPCSFQLTQQAALAEMQTVTSPFFFGRWLEILAPSQVCEKMPKVI